MTRGRGRRIATVLTDALGTTRAARLPAVAAAFSDVCGFPLSRECSARALTRDGRLVVVARSAEWARQVEQHAATICTRVNARIAAPAVRAIEVRVGPAEG